MKFITTEKEFNKAMRKVQEQGCEAIGVDVNSLDSIREYYNLMEAMEELHLKGRSYAQLLQDTIYTWEDMDIEINL